MRKNYPTLEAATADAKLGQFIIGARVAFGGYWIENGHPGSWLCPFWRVDASGLTKLN
jgi:hypothetical protein